MALTSVEKGKLKIIAHVREELELAGIAFESIRCKSGGTLTAPDTVRLLVGVDGTAHQLDLKVSEVEDCEMIVAGATWYRIAALIDGVGRRGKELT